MGKWIIGYVVGAYGGAPGLGAVLALNVPGPIRRIISGFYIHNNTTVPIPLTPVVTADGANEVMISDPTTAAGKRAIRIYTAGALADPVIFLFVETELEYPGHPQAITP